MKVKELYRVVYACPAAWEGKTETGDEIYVRYRHGNFQIYINDELVHERTVGDDFDGYMNDEEMRGHLEAAGFVLEEV